MKISRMFLSWSKSSIVFLEVSFSTKSQGSYLRVKSGFGFLSKYFFNFRAYIFSPSIEGEGEVWKIYQDRDNRRFLILRIKVFVPFGEDKKQCF